MFAENFIPGIIADIIYAGIIDRKHVICLSDLCYYESD